MADLMANVSTKHLKLNRGEEIEGEVIALSDSEVILDLGGKAEGIINKKELPQNLLEKLQVGDTLQAFIVGENPSGQVSLSLQRDFIKSLRGSSRYQLKPEQIKKWQRLSNIKEQKTQISGRVLEINKGGLLVDIDSVRGFLPISQISLKEVGDLEGGLQGLVGKELKLYIIEVDMGNNRLILSTRGEISKELKEQLGKYQLGQEVEGKVAVLAPFGLIINLEGLEGIVYAQETSWDQASSLEKEFSIGQEVKAKVIGKDENLGRINLSIRQLEKDPFEETAKQFEADDVVSGMVTEITSSGTLVQLETGAEGFIPTSKIESGTDYQIGQKASFLVDNVDMGKRRVNLAPFLTSTKGLIYK